MTANNREETLTALAAPFPENLVRTRVGAGGVQLRWVPARSVSERLDQVLGVTGWDFDVQALPDGKTIHGTLRIRLADGSSAMRSDFGYETGGSGETLKEAASDALRRCASLFGVARYLYQGEAGPARSFAKPALAAPVHEDTYVAAAITFAANTASSECPTHGKAWVLKPGGVSRTTGKEYAPFWSCGVKDNAGWCKSKPSPSWLEKNPADGKKEDDYGAVPENTAPLPSADGLEDLPF